MFPWVLCVIFFILLILFGAKILFLKRDMAQVAIMLGECLSTDTNILISVASGDRHIRFLAEELNRQLRLLRRQRRKYLSGDLELKEAVTNISHDLRTPLTAICGYLELLEKEEKSERVKRYLDIIQNRVEVMEQLTEELFRYSVVTAGKNGMEVAPVVINRVLEESMAAYYAALTERGITPDIRMPKEKIIRYLDASALSRVFSNLLTNVLRYSDGDLTVTLSETGEIVFSNMASGLSQVQVGRLFERFYTVEAARKATGLGLAIAKALVERMGGTIWAEYEEGRLSIRLWFRIR